MWLVSLKYPLGTWHRPRLLGEGIALAKKAGVYKGRGKALKARQAADLVRRAVAGEAKAALAREFGVSRQTVYQYLQPGPSGNPQRCR